MPLLPITFAVIFLGIVGLLIHYSILHEVLFKNLFGNVFGQLWLSREISYVSQSVFFVLFVVPLVQWYPTFEGAPLWLRYVVQVPIVLSYAAMFSNLLIAINRCCIVTVPLQYKVVFSYKRTQILVGSVWVMSFLVSILNWIPTCLEMSTYSFGEEKNLPNITETEEFVCTRVRGELDLVVSTGSTAIALLVDLVTFVKVRRISKMREQLNYSGPSKKELKICNMIVAQQLVSVLSAIILNIAYFVSSAWLDRRHLTMIGWTAGAMLDGLVVVLFTPDFCKCKSKSSQVQLTRDSTLNTISHVSNKSAL